MWSSPLSGHSLSCKSLVFELDSPLEWNHIQSWGNCMHPQSLCLCTSVNTSSFEMVSIFLLPSLYRPGVSYPVILSIHVQCSPVFDRCTQLFGVVLCIKTFGCASLALPDSFSKWCTWSNLSMYLRVCVNSCPCSAWVLLLLKQPGNRTVSHCHPAEPCLHAWALYCAWWTIPL